MTSFAWILLLGSWLSTADDTATAAVDAGGITAPGKADEPKEKPAPEAPKPDAKPKPKPDAKPKPKPDAKPEAPKKAPPKKGGPTCSLPTEEGPRGGRLIIQGEDFGRTPVVRIGDRVTRILARQPTSLSVQIPRDSNGGPVTVAAQGVRAACGWLTIVGKDR